MSEEASADNFNIHIGPIIDVNNADRIENNEKINANVICCSCSKE